MRSLHIYAVVDEDWVKESWLQPFTTAVQDAEATLFDLGALRAWAARRDSVALDPDVRSLILGYNFLLFFRDAESGSLEGLLTPNFHCTPIEAPNTVEP